MAIDLSNIGSWLWVIAIIVILYIVVRYFLHIVSRIVHFVFRFFWHGCVTIVVLVVIYYLLRMFHVF